METGIPESIKDELQTKFNIAVPDRIQALIAERRLDKGKEVALFPKIPSAQLWSTFTDEEKSKFKELMGEQGLDADKVLKDHWPKTPDIPKTTRWRVLKH